MTVPFARPFLEGDPRATRLLDDGFRRPASWIAGARARAEQRLSPGVARALEEQNRGLPGSSARAANLAAAVRAGTTFVVAGQQTGLFLGPLYTFYKAASAIAWARAIEAASGVRCVPLFWLQTEDHDFAEIASCEVLPALRLSLPEPGTRCSIAHLRLPPEIAGVLDQIEAALAELPHAPEVLAAVRAAYQPGRPIAGAFAQLLAGVFANEGLLVLDPRCPDVARDAAPLLARALDETAAIERALVQRGRELGEAGFREQVQLRPGSPLVFFHGATPEGPRHRLQRAGDRYAIDGAPAETLDPRVLVAAACAEPLRFSSSALLRPVVQDALLPVVAYVGGPAELGYLAQCAPLYPLFGVRPSIAAPRARFRLVEPRTAALLERLKLRPAELEASREDLLARLGAQRSAGASPGEVAAQLARELDERLAAAAVERPALARAAVRTRASVHRAVVRFAAKQARAAAEADAALVSALDRAQTALYPGGAPQERVYALPAFAARHGFDALKAALFAQLRPGDLEVKDVTP